MTVTLPVLPAPVFPEVALKVPQEPAGFALSVKVTVSLFTAVPL